jgi:hypothetical protein
MLLAIIGLFAAVSMFFVRVVINVQLISAASEEITSKAANTFSSCFPVPA